jgi:hypothetical protein
VAGYIGGDTPHVWTKAEWDAQVSLFRLPIFTASNRNDDNASAINDGAAIRHTLATMAVPAGVTVAVDIETRIYQNYLDELNEQLPMYKLMTYGSVSTLVQNIKTSGGWWGAHWTDDIETGVQAIESREFNAMQWADSTMLQRPYDLSTISSAVPLWHR